MTFVMVFCENHVVAVSATIVGVYVVAVSTDIVAVSAAIDSYLT